MERFAGVGEIRQVRLWQGQGEESQVVNLRHWREQEVEPWIHSGARCIGECCGNNA